jgi:hypothetical protein
VVKGPAKNMEAEKKGLRAGAGERKRKETKRDEQPPENGRCPALVHFSFWGVIRKIAK